MRIVALAVALFAAQPALADSTVAAFVASNPAPGIHEVTGYVVGGFICPPCPPGALCEPCPSDSIYVADAPLAAPLTFDKLTDSVLTIETENPKRYPFGKRFHFRFELPDYKPASGRFREMKLLDAQPR